MKSPFKVKYECIESLKKEGHPVIIVAAVHEAEAIAYACKEHGITISAICDSELRKSQKIFFGIKVIHTPVLPNFFPKARFIIASQHIQECADQLYDLGYEDFYSPLELLKNFDINKYKYKISQSFMHSRLSKKSHEFYLMRETYLRS